MAPSPPSKVPGKMRRFAERHSAAPQIAPERLRKAMGRGLVRLGTNGSLSAISSPRPNTESVETAIVEPNHARRESRKSSRCRCAAQLTATGAVMDRKPATIPIAKAVKAKARSEDIRPIYIAQLLSQGIIIFGSGQVEGSTPTLGCAPSGMIGKMTAQAGCAAEAHMENQTRTQLYFQLGIIVKMRMVPLGHLLRTNVEPKHQSPIDPQSIRELLDNCERNAGGMYDALRQPLEMRAASPTIIGDFGE